MANFKESKLLFNEPIPEKNLVSINELNKFIDTNIS
jgi:hypothetical protein